MVSYIIEPIKIAAIADAKAKGDVPFALFTSIRVSVHSISALSSRSLEDS